MPIVSTTQRNAGIVCSIGAIITLLLSGGQVRTNKEGLELIGNAEGCRRSPYTCPAGFATDGIGNTHDVVAGTVKTDEQIAEDWQRNILDAEWCVNQYADGKRLPDDVFSAAVSLTFRVGCGKVRKSTLFTMLLTGPRNYVTACHQFPRWKWAGGKVMPGLETRSLKEEALCLKGAR